VLLPRCCLRKQHLECVRGRVDRQAGISCPFWPTRYHGCQINTVLEQARRSRLRNPPPLCGTDLVDEQATRPVALGLSRRIMSSTTHRQTGLSHLRIERPGHGCQRCESASHNRRTQSARLPKVRHIVQIGSHRRTSSPADGQRRDRHRVYGQTSHPVRSTTLDRTDRGDVVHGLWALGITADDKPRTPSAPQRM